MGQIGRVNGPPFYDENEWEPDEPAVEKTMMQWMSEWTSWGAWGNSANWQPSPPGGELHGHRILVDGKRYTNVRGEWVPDDS